MKRKRSGFTIVELLTVLAIIALLVGLLVPSLNLVRNIARETKQKAHFATIDQALMAFRNDYGDYPPSEWHPLRSPNYCGAQKLAEALLGRDLLGFNRYSTFDLTQIGVYPTTQPDLDDSLDYRVGPYLDVATANAFKLDYLFPDGTGLLASETFVICDSFGVKKVTIGGKTFKAGSPILYYKANTSSKLVDIDQFNLRIYNVRDNKPLTDDLLSITGGRPHLLDETLFYDKYIIDPKVEARVWPHRADSYILISAGADGLYGTNDDITNFGN